MHKEDVCRQDIDIKTSALILAPHNYEQEIVNGF